MTVPWQVQVLGRLRATRGSRSIDRFPTRKTGALLAFLALEPGRPRARELLLETFWPDSSADAGRNSLSQALSGLRRTLEGPGAAGTVLAADRFSVGLVPGAVETDAGQLRAAWLAARSLEPGDDSYRQALEQAAALYRGELLPGVDGEWVESEREDLARVHLEILGALVRRLLLDGDHRQAIEVARRAVAADPLREPAHRDLLRALAADGRRTEALRHFGELERLLADELGVAPDEESRRLADSIRAGGPTARAEEASAAGRPEAGDSARLVAGGRASILALRFGRDGLAAEALAGYVRSLGRALRALDGRVLRPGLDTTLVAFDLEADALAAALTAQRLARRVEGLGVGAGLHTGELNALPGPDAAPVGPLALRLAEVAQLGRVLLTEEAAIRAGPALEADDRLLDIGRYRLRPDGLPERLFQLQHAQQSGPEGAPVTLLPAQTSRLPVRLSRFVGRQEDRQRLLAQLARPTVRLVTITGMGGSGKTRLAIEAAGAWELQAAAPALWVDLSAVEDARQVGRVIAETLGVQVRESADPLAAVRARLAEGPHLLVLDNFEQLVPAGSALVGELLAASPLVKCLVTSRVRLGLEGEQEFDLRPLPVPDLAAWVAGLERVPSVQLFVDRTRAGDPDFQLTEANAGDVAQLCQALEGIPLAIELAAARATVLSPRQMLERLSSRLAWLAVKRADIGERQRSLRGTIDWSYDLLDAPTRADFEAVAVFKGGWDIEAAEAVLGDELAIERMAELRDASLVLSDTTAGGVRYGMLEVVRLFAAEKLDPPREQALRARHARHYAALAEAAEPALTGPDQPAWIQRLAADHENFMSAMAWCAEQSAEVATGLRLACGLNYYWYTRGHLRAGLEHTARLLARPEAAEEPVLQARALRIAGALATFLGDSAAAQGYLEQALALQRAAGDERAASLSLYQLAVLAHKQGDDDRARKLATESAAHSRTLEGPQALRGLAAALNLLGVVGLTSGNLAAAVDSLEESLAIVRGLGDGQGIANVLDNLVEIELRSGELDAATMHAREIVALADEVGSRWMALKALCHLATVAAKRGDLVGSAQLLAAVDAQCAAIEPSMAAEIRTASDPQVGALRVRMGDAAFAQAWRAGQAWSWATVIEQVGGGQNPATTGLRASG